MYDPTYHRASQSLDNVINTFFVPILTGRNKVTEGESFLPSLHIQEALTFAHHEKLPYGVQSRCRRCVREHPLIVTRAPPVAYLYRIYRHAHSARGVRLRDLDSRAKRSEYVSGS